jgi:general secretion pathway protein H
MNVETGHRARRSEQGFTLFELIIALGIMVLGVALVLPLVNRSRAGYELRAAAYDIATQLRDVRAAAQMRSMDQAIIIDVGNRRIWMEGAETRKFLPAGVAVDVEVPVAEQLGDKTVRVRFFPDGSSSGGKLLLREGARQAAVTINWLNGDVRVQ